MANGIRIDNLNNATSLNDTDLMTIVQDKENKKLPMSLIDCDGSYSQSVINTIPDLITTSKSNVENTKQAINEKFGEDEFSAQINTVKEMSSIGISDDSSVDVSSQVQDGFMETAILYGKTLVNNITTDTSNDDYVAFDKDYNGQNFSISGTVEGSIKSAILKGNTLVNLNSSGKSKSSSTNVCEFTMTYLKPNTTYTVTFEMSYEGTESSGVLGFLTADKSNWNVNKSYSGNGSYKELLTTTSSIDLGVTLRFRRNVVDGNFTISNVIVLEGDYTNVDIPYFTGMQSVKMPVLTTTGKNLFDGELEIGGLSTNGLPNNTQLDRHRSKNYTKVKSSTKYVVYNNYSSTVGIREFDEDYNLVSWSSLPSSNTFTTSNNTKYLKFIIINTNDDNLLQLEEGSVATQYEPYKTNILTVNEDVELGSVGEVKDELDLLTGKITQRTDIRPYQESDESDSEVLTDMTNTRYKLAQEVVKTVDLSILDQDGHITNNIHTFNETTHINTSSQGLIPEISISKSVSYDALIKPSTQYTIDLKHNDKNMTVNVGGNEIVFASGETRKAITTPSALTNNTLSYYGLGAKANSIMLLEGNETRDLDYFNGMKSVKYTTHEDGNKLPVLTTTGKNLCGAMESGSLTQIEGEPTGHTSRIRTVDYIPIDSSYWVSAETSTSLGLRYYDNNKKCIGYPTIKVSAYPINVTNIPSGAKYLKFTVVDVTDVNYKIYLTKEQHTMGEYEPHKSNILTVNEDVELGSVGEAKDELILLTGQLTQRTETRAYREGDEANSEVVTDMTNTRYKLPKESIKTVDLNSSNGDVKTPVIYKNGHILLQSDGLIPELHYSIPVSYSGLIAQNTMTNLKHSWRLDELELLAYASIVNSQYDSLMLVSTAETNDIMVSSDYVPDVSLYNMLKVLVNANALQNADEKISTFYLYGKLSDEMFIDLIMGDDM